MDLKDVLKKPLLSEKLMTLSALGQYGFLVDRRATRKEVALAVEAFLNAKVSQVRIINTKSKQRRVGRRRLLVLTSPWKKAIIKLKKGEKLDLFEEK